MLRDFITIQPEFQEVYPLIKDDFNELRWASLFFNMAFNSNAHLVVLGAFLESLALCFSLALQKNKSKKFIYSMNLPSEREAALYNRLEQYNCEVYLKFFDNKKVNLNKCYIFTDLNEHDNIASLTTAIHSMIQKNNILICNGVEEYQKYRNLTESIDCSYSMWHENLFIGKII